MLAILLICAAAIAPHDCTEATAIQSTRAPVANEIECQHGAQISAAAMPVALSAGEYIRVECRRAKH